VLEPAVLQFALHADSTLVLVHLHDECGVRQAEQFRQNRTGLPIAQIVALDAVSTRSGASARSAAAIRRAAASGS